MSYPKFYFLQSLLQIFASQSFNWFDWLLYVGWRQSWNFYLWCNLAKKYDPGSKRREHGREMKAEKERKRLNSLEHDMKYFHMLPDKRDPSISWSVERVKCISIRMEIPCSVSSVHHKEGNWLSIHASALSFIIKDAAILVAGPEMWWYHMTFSDSEWNPGGGACTPHLCFSHTQLLTQDNFTSAVLMML